MDKRPKIVILSNQEPASIRLVLPLIGAIDDDFKDIAAGKWLKQNCATYGFILRYPKEKETITGYMYEPWHIRYVGKKAAMEIMQNELTLEEYLTA